MVKERIIEESCKLFVNYGVKMTMDDIAKHLGVSKRTIYENFKDKNELLIECIEYDHIRHSCHASGIFAKADNVLEACIEMMQKKRTEDKRNDIRILIDLRKYYPSVYNDHMLKHQDERLNGMADVIRKGIKEGVFRPEVNPTLSAFIFSEQLLLVLSEQFYQLHVRDNYDSDLAIMDILEDMSLTYMRGISTPKGLEILEKYLNNKNNKTPNKR